MTFFNSFTKRHLCFSIRRLALEYSLIQNQTKPNSRWRLEHAQKKIHFDRKSNSSILVGSIVNKSSADAQKTVQDLSKISLKDEILRNGGDGYASNKSPLKDSLPTGGTTKEEVVDSLSFSVMGATAFDQSIKEEPMKQSAKDVGSSNRTTAEEILRTKKPIARTKVPFEKGYSQMDWLKLTRTHPDLAGLKGQSNRRLISIDEVKQNRTEGSMWTVLKGRVYNIYPYMKFHPGGVDMLMKAVGKDCTSMFNKYHAWVNDEFLLEKCLVGILDESSTKK